MRDELTFYGVYAEDCRSSATAVSTDSRLQASIPVPAAADMED